MNNEHHVVWSDRLGINKIWFEDWKTCSAYYGTDEYPLAVERFENDIVNVNDGPALYNEIQKYKKDDLDKQMKLATDDWVRDHPMESQNPSYIRDLNFFLIRKRASYLHHFIIQLLEDNKFGFYKSKVMEDEIGLDE